MESPHLSFSQLNIDLRESCPATQFHATVVEILSHLCTDQQDTSGDAHAARILDTFYHHLFTIADPDLAHATSPDANTRRAHIKDAVDIANLAAVALYVLLFSRHISPNPDTDTTTQTCPPLPYPTEHNHPLIKTAHILLHYISPSHLLLHGFLYNISTHIWAQHIIVRACQYGHALPDTPRMIAARAHRIAHTYTSSYISETTGTLLDATQIDAQFIVLLINSPYYARDASLYCRFIDMRHILECCGGVHDAHHDDHIILTIHKQAVIRAADLAEHWIQTDFLDTTTVLKIIASDLHPLYVHVAPSLARSDTLDADGTSIAIFTALTDIAEIRPYILQLYNDTRTYRQYCGRINNTDFSGTCRALETLLFMLPTHKVFSQSPFNIPINLHGCDDPRLLNSIPHVFTSFYAKDIAPFFVRYPATIDHPEIVAAILANPDAYTTAVMSCASGTYDFPSCYESRVPPEDLHVLYHPPVFSRIWSHAMRVQAYLYLAESTDPTKQCFAEIIGHQHAAALIRNLTLLNTHTPRTSPQPTPETSGAVREMLAAIRNLRAFIQHNTIVRAIVFSALRTYLVSPVSVFTSTLYETDDSRLRHHIAEQGVAAFLTPPTTADIIADYTTSQYRDFVCTTCHEEIAQQSPDGAITVERIIRNLCAPNPPTIRTAIYSTHPFEYLHGEPYIPEANYTLPYIPPSIDTYTALVQHIIYSIPAAVHPFNPAARILASTPAYIQDNADTIIDQVRHIASLMRFPDPTAPQFKCDTHWHSRIRTGIIDPTSTTADDDPFATRTRTAAFQAHLILTALLTHARHLTKTRFPLPEKASQFIYTALAPRLLSQPCPTPATPDALNIISAAIAYLQTDSSFYYE